MPIIPEYPKSDTSPFDLGKLAYIWGKSAHESPYPIGSADDKEWYAGWLYANENKFK